MDSPEARTCRRCQRPEGAGTRFRQTTVPDKVLGKRPVTRRVCVSCEVEVARERRAAKRQPPAPPPDELRRVLFIPDCHVPFHDLKSWGVMLRAAQVLQPHVLVLLGDFADFYAASFHDKDPRRINNIPWECERVNEALDQLDTLGASEKIYCSGNHEHRLDRLLAKAVPQLVGWKGLSVPEAFRLTERGWRWVPYQDTCRVGKLHVTHDLNRSGQNAHRHAGDKFRGSALIGHTHAMELSVVGGIDGHSALRAMFGWLGNYEDLDYRHHAVARAEWVHGFGVGYLEASGVCHVQPVPIVGGRCVVQGRLVA